MPFFVVGVNNVCSMLSFVVLGGGSGYLQTKVVVTYPSSVVTMLASILKLFLVVLDFQTQR